MKRSDKSAHTVSQGSGDPLCIPTRSMYGTETLDLRTNDYVKAKLAPDIVFSSVRMIRKGLLDNFANVNTVTSILFDFLHTARQN